MPTGCGIKNYTLTFTQQNTLILKENTLSSGWHWLQEIRDLLQNLRIECKKIRFRKQCIIFITCIVIMCIYLAHPSQEGFDTKPILKQTTAGLNLEFSFFYISCLTKVEQPSLLYYLFLAERRDGRMDWFQRYFKLSRFIQCQEVRESGSLCVYIYIFCSSLKRIFLVSSCVNSTIWMHHMDEEKAHREKLDGNNTRMLRAILNKSLKQYPPK